jgi:hypothetical protein
MKVGVLPCAPVLFLNVFQGDSLNQGDLVVEIVH